MTGRFLNADSSAGANKDILSYNLFAYCSNNPVNFSDPTGNFVIADDILIGIAIVCIFGFVAASTCTVAAPPIVGNNALDYDFDIPDNIIKFPKLPKPKQKESPSPHAVPNPKSNDDSDDDNGMTYYHVTTSTNAALIWASGALVGSSYEGGYVFAWTSKPSKKAMELSGAHQGTIISFKTKAAFERDPGINDSYILKYGPVRSVSRGPVMIYDIKIIR